ncbi:MAG: alpha-hydroxy acid oxidase [Desulfobacteraceae bacterium]
MKRIYSIDCARQVAKRRLPKMVFHFVDGGAEDETTLCRNRKVFDQITFKPRVLTGVTRRDLSATVFDRDLNIPVMLSPTGLLRLVSREAELAAVKACGKTGTIFVLSTASSYTIEEVAAVATSPLWFQLYLSPDQQINRSLIQRAQTTGYQALCLTVDTPTAGKRERDIRTGMTIPPRIGFKNVMDSAWRVRWVRDYLFGRKITFRNLVDYGETDNIMTLASFMNKRILNPGATWEDFNWLRKIWKRQIVVKGIMSAEDAMLAVDRGADGILVSNHGGRQLESSPSTIEILPEVVEAVGGHAEIFLDGGIRRGRDVVKAKALGASACLIGRPYLWGLAIGGERGVSHILDLLQDEIDRTLAFIGQSRFKDVERSAVRVRKMWQLVESEN